MIISDVIINYGYFFQSLKAGFVASPYRTVAFTSVSTITIHHESYMLRNRPSLENGKESPSAKIHVRSSR
jgi:hypothetical protein